METQIKKTNIVNFLTSLTNKKFFYWPNPGNAGDALIAHSTYLLFDSLNLDYEIIEDTSILRNQTVVFAGGGNLIEGKYDHMYNELLNAVKYNHCIILPHTVSGYPDLINKNRHSLTIYCREFKSYANCTLYNKKNIFLTDDMAFYYPKEYFSSFEQRGLGTAYCFRTDSESTRLIEIPVTNRDISCSWNGNIWSNKLLAKYVSLSLASYLASFESVETDRLHIAILGSLLKKKVKLFSNNYYKNKAVFENSIVNRFPHTSYIHITS
ncbi:MAG: polysaccharide pyruvyl transferase family protein [Snodgrassella sp.]|nr:polysaccharide pyruvyl transferase family protein [Snodgrassella sp.]